MRRNVPVAKEPNRGSRQLELLPGTSIQIYWAVESAGPHTSVM